MLPAISPQNTSLFVGKMACRGQNPVTRCAHCCRVAVPGTSQWAEIGHTHSESYAYFCRAMDVTNHELNQVPASLVTSQCDGICSDLLSLYIGNSLDSHYSFYSTLFDAIGPCILMPITGSWHCFLITYMSSWQALRISTSPQCPLLHAYPGCSCALGSLGLTVEDQNTAYAFPGSISAISLFLYFWIKLGGLKHQETQPFEALYMVSLTGEEEATRPCWTSNHTRITFPSVIVLVRLC